MKKIGKLLIMSAAVSGLSSCGSSDSPKEFSLSFASDSPTSLTVGETAKISVNLVNGETSDLRFVVDDPLIGSIDREGNLTALRNGVVNVKVIPSGHEDLSISRYIDVNSRSGITIAFTQSVTSAAVGETVSFHAEVRGDSSNSGVGYLLNNYALASISDEGEVHIVQKGVEEKLIVTAYSKANPDVSVDVTVHLTGENPSDGIQKVHGYSLIFQDDFRGERLNTNNWEYMIGDGGNNKGWGNEELEFYRKENIKLVDGQMVITAKYCDSNKNSGQNYSSGRIRSHRKVAYTYGRVEARIACPFGNGLWPAFWMLPDPEGLAAYGSWPNSGEIDIMEAKGRVKYSIDSTLHDADRNGNHIYQFGTNVFPVGQDISQFHDYAVEWDENEFRWYVDGSNEPFHRCNADTKPWGIKTGTGEFPAPFNKPFHILFNMAVGGNYDGYRVPDEDEVPAQMKVAYVKWYQK